MRLGNKTPFSPMSSTIANFIAGMKSCNTLSKNRIEVELIIPSDFTGTRSIENKKNLRFSFNHVDYNVAWSTVFVSKNG